MARVSAATPRPARTLTQKLGAVVLGFEAVVVFLAGLTVFGLRALPASIPPWWAIIGGLLVALAMIATAGAITRPGAIAVGWALQGVVALSALLVPAIALVVLIFGGMWAYATIVGGRADRQNRNGSPTDTHTESEGNGH